MAPACQLHRDSITKGRVHIIFMMIMHDVSIRFLKCKTRSKYVELPQSIMLQNASMEGIIHVKKLPNF